MQIMFIRVAFVAYKLITRPTFVCQVKFSISKLFGD